MRTPLVPFQRIRSFRRKYSLFLLMFGITCSTLLLSVAGSSLRTPKAITAPQSGNPETRKKSRKRKCDACSQPTTQEIYIPLIDLPEARGGGELVFNSRSPEALDVTPVFYRLNGTMVRGNPVRIQSTEIRYVNIRELIPAPYRHEGNWGGLSLTYNGFNREMWSQFRFLEVNGGGNVDEFFTVKEESRSDLLEAVWWMPRQSEAIIALGNITDIDTSATINFNDGRTRTVKLKPHETEIIRQNDRGNDAAASVRIDVTGAAGSIVPTGIITARDGSFNSVIRFYNPNVARQPHLFANGLRIADVTAHMILRNTSAASVTVQPEFIPVSGRFTGDTLVLPQVNLRPNEVIEVDLSALRAMATNNRALETVSVQISNTGPAGSVIGSIYGINNRTGTSYDVPLRDSGPARSMTGSYPWKISDDFSTVVYVTNISDQEAQFITQINYPGGNLVFEPRKVGPGETAVFDLKKIRDEGLKDLAGKQLPANVSQGQFKWAVRGMTNGKLVLIGRAEMISSSQQISTSYSCNDPCPPYYGGDINPFPPPVVINGQATTAIWETAYYDTGYVVGPYSTWATWTNLYDPVVTFDPSNGHSTTITGVETGGTTLHGFIAMQQDYGWDGLNCYEYGYYEESADTPVEVACAVPINFHQTAASDTGSGTLHFEYAWESSTGNIADLAQCTVGEKVDYTASELPFASPPFPAGLNPNNPTIVNVAGNFMNGSFRDDHRTPGTFVKPYSAATVTASQIYRYSCPCKDNGAFVTLLGPHNIVRSVSQNTNGSWKFTVTKTGASAAINPLP